MYSKKEVNTDHEVSRILINELQRQETTINLIASENYASQAVVDATGSIMTNKYAEGYPGKRYYAGCEFIDQIEVLAQERCKKIFDAQHTNVQPHAGSQANMAAYLALCKPGDTIMGMSLNEGGHLTHGHPVNFSGLLFNVIPYSLNKETEQLDYEKIEQLAQIHKPKLIIAGASAYSRIIDFERFAKIAQAINAYLVADIAHIAGLIATNLHPSPIPYADVVTSTTHKTLRGPRGGLIMCKQEHAQAIDKTVMPGIQGGPCMNVIAAKAVCFQEASREDFSSYQKQVIKNAKVMAEEFISRDYRIVSGGTDNHLFLIDLTAKKITGKEAEILLSQAGIYVNRNCIPFDPEKPWIASGIRIGTPAITTRGMKEEQAKEIVWLIDEVLASRDNSNAITRVKDRVSNICNKFPIYG